MYICYFSKKLNFWGTTKTQLIEKSKKLKNNKFNKNFYET